MREIYDYTCEFSKWHYKAFDSNVNMTILVDTYYEKLPRKLSYYFLEEFEKKRQDDTDRLGARIEFLTKRLAELCTQRYIIKGSRNGERIFCNKIENVPKKWGCNDYRKRKHGRHLKNQIKNLQNIKDLKMNGESHLKNIIRKDSTTKEEIIPKTYLKTKIDANVENVEKENITTINAKRRKGHSLYREMTKKMM